MKNYFEIAKVTATGWAPAWKQPIDQANPVEALYGLCEGAGAQFGVDLWVTPFSSADGSAPKGLVKLAPRFAAVASAEFPTEAAEIYLFDAPFLWIRPNVITLSAGGALTLLGVRKAAP